MTAYFTWVLTAQFPFQSCVLCVFQERERMLQHFQLLKGEMNRLREIERSRLTKLTLESSAAIKEIKRKSVKVGFF